MKPFQKDNGRRSFINEKGVEFEKNWKYVWSFQNGFAKVQKGKRKYIFINEKGEETETLNFLNKGSRGATFLFAPLINYCNTGCFYGNLEEFEEAVKKTYSFDDEYYKEYMEVIKECKKLMEEGYKWK